MALHPRNILSLCAGVGGLELGILLALHHRGEAGRGVCYVEREAAAAASLVASMEAGWLHPAPVWSDMLTFDARPWRGAVHILASGDPCQDNSVAGKRAGADGERFLAAEVTRLAEECRPDLVFRENVPGNAEEQLEAIAPPLEGLGYRVAAGIFSSARAGNTMRRERLFIMAQRICAGLPCPGCGSEHGGVGEQPGVLCGTGMEGAERGDGIARPHDTDVSAGGRTDDILGRSGVALGGAVGCSDRRFTPDEGRGPVGRTVADGAGNGRDQAVGQYLARACREGPQGHEFGGASGSEFRVGAPRSAAQFRGALLPPAVIPGPTDSRWIDVLDRFPELQPALSQEEAESHLRRGIDAVAHRVERLRATGNGVDSVVAADAFVSLSARLGA